MQEQRSVIDLEARRVQRMADGHLRTVRRLALIARVMPNVPKGIAAIWVRPIDMFAVRPGLSDDEFAIAADLCVLDRPGGPVAVVNDDDVQEVIARRTHTRPLA